MQLERLADKFYPDEIEWRIQRSGVSNNKPWAVVLCYVTNRAIQSRLDEVCGIENWRNEYAAGPQGGVVCGISIRVGSEWVTKWDGADNTQVESIKGGLSDSMKRAAVQWGIGRYLYKLEATFAECSLDKSRKHNAKFDKQYGSWDEPKLPDWAMPEHKDRYAALGLKLQEHWDSVNAIKQFIAEGNLSSAAEAFGEIPEEDRMALNLARTKGGCWTKEEVDVFKSPEWSEARKNTYG